MARKAGTSLAAGPGPGRLRGRPSRKPMSNAATWATAGLITPAVLSAAFAAASVPGDRGYAVVIVAVACAYFLYWLSAGADLLWEWHSGASVAARPCVRCAHTAAAHPRRATCAVRAGSLDVWERCACAGYVPPGVSPGRVS